MFLKTLRRNGPFERIPLKPHINIQQRWFDYRGFNYKPFSEAKCKQTYWDNLAPENKYEHYKNGCYYGITMSANEFNKLVGTCDIILKEDDVKQDKLTHGLVLENLEKGIRFDPVRAIFVNKGVVLYYMSIPDDANIMITGDSLIRKYRATKLIVKNIWTSDKDYAREVVKGLMSSMPVRDENGCINGSVY